MGRGEYVVQLPKESPIGHFGLAVRDYSHSTAPNRRFPDLITQRLLKAAFEKKDLPYSTEELVALALHCTENENAADKVERRVRKSASAMFLSSRVGQYFNGIVTGTSESGVWARVLDPPVEGKIVNGGKGLDVGDRVRLKLTSVSVEMGYIDFSVAEK
jgi:exoribonuclease-2